MGTQSAAGSNPFACPCSARPNATLRAVEVRDYNENCGVWTWLRRHDCRRLPLQDGHEVIGVDVSNEKVAIVNAGKSPITSLASMNSWPVRLGRSTERNEGCEPTSRQLRHGHNLCGNA
jgi:hypothetical protein